LNCRLCRELDEKGASVGRILTERTAVRRRYRKVVASAVCIATVFLVTGCSQNTEDQWKRLGLPVDASDRGPYMKTLWIGAWIACLVVGVLVWGLIAYVSIRYRRKSDDEVPHQMRYHMPIELLYTVAPLVVVAVFFFFTVEKQDKIDAAVEHPAHKVLVTAQQWSWTFSYLHEPATGGTNVYDAGSASKEPVLWLVKDQSVTFDLHSADVIHSFWVPSFYFKRDVIPGRENTFSMTPTRLGTYVGRCAELCGYLHSQMLFHVHVVTQAQFEAHLRSLKTRGFIGAPQGGEQVRTIVGLGAGHNERSHGR
jgi:cytochrome c oxidase subunit 2